MKVISLNKKLWNEVVITGLGFVPSDCDFPLVSGCGGISNPCYTLCPRNQF
ncbi:MAG: hypothetical protein WBA22_01345 [Candidatus Methanofastidiosia archaeon]